MSKQPIQPSLRVVSDAHVKSTVSLQGENASSPAEPSGGIKQLSEVSLSAAAAATLIAAVRLAASDQGDAAKTWAESVDQNSAPSVACWLYAKMIMTDRYHPTQRGYLPFVYDSAAEAATAFFAEELRSIYPHLDKDIEAQAYSILEELMLLSGHLPSDYELAWHQKPKQRSASKMGFRPILWLGRVFVNTTVGACIYLWFFLVHLSGCGHQLPRKTAKVPISPHPPVDATSVSPRPTTPAVPPSKGPTARR